MRRDVGVVLTAFVVIACNCLTQDALVAMTGYSGGAQIGTATSNSYSDPALTASTAYTYTVAANDAAGTNSAQSTSASATTPSGSFVYDDTLHWNNWSWGTTLNPSVTAPVFAGTKSLGITFTEGYAGAYFNNAGFDTTPFTNLSFMIQPSGPSLPALRVYLINSTGAKLTFIDPSTYATPSAGGWYSVTIPLSALSGASKTLTGVVIHEFSGAAQPTFYVDDLAFVGNPQSTSASATTPSGSFVYDDTLHWNNWSWGTTLNPSVTAPVFAGTKSLGITFTEGYAGAYFNNAGFDTTPFTNLSFMIQPNGPSLPALRVYLIELDRRQTHIHRSIDLCDPLDRRLVLRHDPAFCPFRRLEDPDRRRYPRILRRRAAHVLCGRPGL